MEREDLIAVLAAQVPDERVLEAISAVDRRLFVPPDQRGNAWENEALPIGEGQTISQPLIVALMCRHLEIGPDDLVLDIGTGSGYHAAVLSRLGRRVISIERHGALLEAARESLAAAGIGNVTLVQGDGSAGYPQEAPYDAINIAACSPEEPRPDLLMQLADGGRLVVPVGRGRRQRLLVCRREDGEIHRRWAEEVAFVPLVEGEP